MENQELRRILSVFRPFATKKSKVFINRDTIELRNKTMKISAKHQNHAGRKTISAFFDFNKLDEISSQCGDDLSIVEVDDNHYLMGGRENLFLMNGTRIPTPDRYDLVNIPNFPRRVHGHCQISGKLLSRILKTSLLSITPSHSRPILNAIHFSGGSEKIIIDSTDGTRFTRQTVPDSLFQGSISGDFFLHFKHAKSIIKLLTNYQENTIGLDHICHEKEEYLYFGIENLQPDTVFTFNLLNGKYSNVDSLTRTGNNSYAVYFQNEEVWDTLQELKKTKAVKKASPITLNFPDGEDIYYLYFESGESINKMGLKSISQNDMFYGCFTLTLKSWLEILEPFDNRNIEIQLMGLPNITNLIFSGRDSLFPEISIETVVKPYSLGLLDRNLTDGLLFHK